jgi:hypothetical protein
MLSELDIRVLDDLHTISPRISELYPSPGQQWHSRIEELLSNFLFIVYDKAKMAASVGMRTVPFKESNKLIAHIDEGHFLAATAQRELKRLAIE